MSSNPKPYISPEEYLQLERKAEFKSEYFRGEVFAMAGASRNHGRILANVLAGIHRQLRQTNCNAYASDLRVSVSASGLYTYPDVVVTCGEEKLIDGDTLTNPVLIIEVLSPSTQDYDRGQKFQLYRNLPSLVEYMTVAQDSVHVEHYRSQGNGKWLLEETDELSSGIAFGCIPAQLTVADIYEKVTFEPASPAAESA